MKKLTVIIGLAMLSACSISSDGIVIDTPSIPSINVCEHVANDADISNMKAQIDSESFKDDRLQRAKTVTKGYCFISSQVVSIMESMVFEDARLEMAKDLYDQTTDKKTNYYLCVDFLTHKSDKDELKQYMLQNP